MADIMDRGIRDVKYPSGKAKSIRNNPEGIPDPCLREFIAEDGVQDDEVAERRQSEVDYNPIAEKQTGDSGLG